MPLPPVREVQVGVVGLVETWGSEVEAEVGIEAEAGIEAEIEAGMSGSVTEAWKLEPRTLSEASASAQIGDWA